MMNDAEMTALRESIKTEAFWQTHKIVLAKDLADGKLKIIGSTPVKCTDYGLKPFSFLGIATCGDDLKISFEWVLAAKAP